MKHQHRSQDAAQSVLLGVAALLVLTTAFVPRADATSPAVSPPAMKAAPSATLQGACPSSGLTASSTEELRLTGTCVINGNLVLSGNAHLTVIGGVLAVKGNLVLSDNAMLAIWDGGLVFPQTNYYQYAMTLSGRSSLLLRRSVLVTNGTQNNNFSMTLQACDSSVVEFVDSNLDTNSGSWLLGNFSGASHLHVTGSQNLPTETYVSGSAQAGFAHSSTGLWLDFEPGTGGTIQVPQRHADGTIDFALGPGPGQGIDYEVSLSSTQSGIGIMSHPNSRVVVDGSGSPSDAQLVFGYYIENNTGPVSVDGLPVDVVASRKWTDQGRVLQLNHVHLSPIAWQVYVTNSNNFPVSISHSFINEIAAFENGHVDIADSVLQLAVTGALGPGAAMHISQSQIWSQTVQAEDGGQLAIDNSQLHGNFLTAVGSGSKISMTNVGLNQNGASSVQSCAPVGGYPPTNGGVPVCNPFNPLHECPVLGPVTGGASVIDHSKAGGVCPLL